MTTLMLLVPSLWLRDTVGFISKGYEVTRIVVLDGRNDGTNRVYAAASYAPSPTDIYEFDWSGTWSGGIIYTLPFEVRGAFTGGDGRNDGVNRLYAADLSCSAQLWELSWSGSLWDTTSHGDSDPASDGNLNLSLGDGRNDGVNRLYTALRLQAPSRYSVAEWSWSGSRWVQRLVGARSADMFSWTGFALGDGRGDGVTRLYHAEQREPFGESAVYEYSRLGGAWQERFVGTLGTEVPDVVSVAALRPDGVARVYALYPNVWSHLREYTYAPNNARERVSFSSAEVTTLRNGVTMTEGDDPCGSGRQQLFVATRGGSVVRVYRAGGGWVTETVDSLGVWLLSVAIADGRSDGVPRVYVAGAGGYVYELSCVPQSAEETEPAQPLTLRAEAGALRFALPAASAVTLALYDASGRRRAPLFYGTLSAGEHAFALPELPRGVYVARLAAGGRSVGVTLVR